MSISGNPHFGKRFYMQSACGFRMCSLVAPASLVIMIRGFCAANFCPALLGTIFSLPLGNLFHFLTYVSIKEMLAFLLGKISSFRLTTSFHQWQKEKRWKCSFVVNEATLPLTDACYNHVRSYTALPIGHNAFSKLYWIASHFTPIFLNVLQKALLVSKNSTPDKKIRKRRIRSMAILT